MHVLVVDDDEHFRAQLKRALYPRHVVDEVASGTDALRWLGSFVFDLVVLDEWMGHPSGREVCLQMRARNDATPVLMVTADRRTNTEVSAREAGADWFLSKARGPAVLQAAIDGVARQRLRSEPNLLHAPPVMVDPRRGVAEVDGNVVPMRPKELALLETLIAGPGRVWSTEELKAKLWDYADPPGPSALPKHVERLRKALVGTSAAAMVVTRPRMGYVFDPTQCGATPH